jgi:RHS repeat-associated protein
MHRAIGYSKLASNSLLVSVFLAVISIALAHGQANDYQIGLPLHGQFSGSDFEHVQMNNNNLHIDLPLWSASGRGPSVGFKYVYDSLGWGFNETCNRISGLCTDRVVPTPNWQRRALPNHLTLTLVGPQSYTVAKVNGSFTCNGTGITLLTYTYTLGAPDGTSHRFEPEPVEIGGQGAHCLPEAPTTLYADDGSGWMLSVDTNGNVLKLVAKDGSVLGGAAIAEDSNGNQILSASPITDTLGRTVNTDGSYYDSNGVRQTIPVVNQSVAIQTNLCGYSGADFCYEYSSTWSVPQTISLPNGKSYTFTYDQGSSTHPYYGQPLSVTLPTGGTITWGWNGENDSGPHLASRQLSGDPGPWQYTGGYGGTETDPAGNDTVYTCTGYGPRYSYDLVAPDPLPCYITSKKYYQGSSTTGTLIRTVQTDYWTTNSPAILPIRETTTWNPQNLVSKVEMDYDSWNASSFGTTTFLATGGNVVEKREYAYGTGSPGSVVRTTDNSFLHITNATYRSLNILNRVTSTKVYAGSSQTGTLVAQTTNTYDGVAIPTSGDTSGSPAPNHDYTNYSRTNNVRGNLTQTSRGLKTGSTWTWLSTNYTYNDLGEILTMTDPGGHTTTNDYTDNWASITNAQCVTSAHSYAFPTTITDPLGHRLKHQYYSCTSLVGSDQDENDIAASRAGTTYSYDLMSRLVTKSLPDGGSTSLTFNETTLPYSVTSSTAVTASLSIRSTSVFDGLGRIQQNQKNDPDCTAGLVKADYTYGYGTQGRTTQTSTPYCNSAGGNFGLTATTNFETLERPVSVQQTDSSNASATYAGNCQTSTDERGNSRKSCFDALGRLIQVFEDPGNSPHLNYETDYAYDVLSNLVSVTQKGGAASTSWRTRTFTYDSLSRLTCAANPEITAGLSTVNPASCPATYSGTYTAGTVGYTYDADSNLLAKQSPAPNQTGSATVTITYSYNADHQLTATTYSDGTTPNVHFGYNGTALTGCTNTPPTLSDNNAVHTRTAMCDGSGATSWSHDAMGRVLTEKKAIVGSSTITNTTSFGYYLDGELKTATYPKTGRTITYTPNGSGGYTAGRPVSAVDTVNNINFVTGATYSPHGGVATLTLGVSINGAETYNSRMQPLQIYYTVGTISSGTITQLQSTTCPTTVATIMSRLYDFGQAGSSDNGTVQSIKNCRDNNRTQNFQYDSLNRVTQASTTGPNWGETFTIDAWGNLTNKGPVSGKTNTENLNVAPANIKNQLNGLCNDAAGNLVLNSGCPTGTFTPTYQYDAENRLIATGGVTYTYDGDGRRVKKSNGMLYWAGSAGDALVETDLAGNTTAEYVFFNGRRVARIDQPSGSIQYYFSDHLGSADVITNASGTITKESDYYPYGGEIAVVTGDSNRYKFSGKERDSESGLDNFGARYDSSSLGRFMTPDWAARPTTVPYAVFGDPQSLNLYGYVRNDPVSRADADGHQGPKQTRLSAAPTRRHFPTAYLEWLWIFGQFTSRRKAKQKQKER